MTTPTPASQDDDSEALYWLRMARRILSGEMAPNDARTALNAGEKARMRGQQPVSAQH